MYLIYMNVLWLTEIHYPTKFYYKHMCQFLYRKDFLKELSTFINFEM